MNPLVKLEANGLPLNMPQGSPINIYIGPGFSASEVSDIKAAATAWVNSGALGSVSYTTVDPGARPTNGNISIMQGQLTNNLIGQEQSIGYPSSATIVGAVITFDRNQIYKDGSPMYSAGILNGGDTFFTDMMEFGHALGLDDFHDASGNEIDAPGPTAMGQPNGTNNNGVPQAIQIPVHRRATSGRSHPATSQLYWLTRVRSEVELTKNLCRSTG